MVDNIFRDYAPKYWAVGLPVIPLKQSDKMPLTDGWSFYSSHMPNQAEQDHWLKTYPHSNIGLVLGPQSGLVMVDIDTDDVAIQTVIKNALMPFVSPWERFGRRGLALAFRQPKSGPLKTFHISRSGVDKSEAGLVDFLSTGSQLVLPPSIHPKTQKPYTENASLIDVLANLPCIPSEIETIIRQALEDHGIELSHSGWTKVTDYAAVGARDNQMTRVAGLWAQGVTRGELSLLEAIDRMHAWNETQVQHIAGDEIDVHKGVQNLIGFLTRDVLERKKTLPKGWDVGMNDTLKKSLGLEFTDDHVEWTFDQVMNYLRVEFEKHTPSSEGWFNTVSATIERLSRSTEIDSSMQEVILKYISEVSHGKVTVSTLKGRVKEFKQGDLKGQDHTEIAYAAIERMNEFGELRFFNAKFWQWGGSHWEVKPENDLLHVIADNYGSMPAAKRRSDHKGIAQIMSTLCQKPLRDSPVIGVNFANGYLTPDLKLLPHAPEYGCNYILPFRYLPELADKAQKFQSFLDRLWTDPQKGPDPDIADKKAALQEAMAATLFGVGTSYFRVIMLHGLSNTGKSQILEIIGSLVPPEARSAVPPNDWADKFLPAQLSNKLLNLAGELSETKKIDGQRFKQVVDGSEITVQFKNQQPFECKMMATHWFASNHLPKTNDTSDGFNRRWLILDFRHRLQKSEIIRNIGQLLVAEEREAIVAWAVQGLARLEKQTEYTLPVSHIEVLQRVANSNNSVRYFMEKSPLIRVVQPAPGGGSRTSHHMSETQLYDVFCGFLREEGDARRVTLTQFTMRMKELEGEMGFRRTTKHIGNNIEIGVYENIIPVEQRMAA